MKVKTDFGTYDVTIIGANYLNGNLALNLVTTDGEPFARLTVNLGDELMPYMAFVDTNNCPWAEDFIRENELGEPMGYYERSGFCEYPLYWFDEEKLIG